MKLDPTTLIIFGATGELSQKRLLPALARLDKKSLLPEEFQIVGFARTIYSDQEFRKQSKLRGKFAKKVFYYPGNFDNPDDFRKLAKKVSQIEGPHSFLKNTTRSGCTNRLFYFATLPSHYQTIPQELKSSGFLVACQIHQRKTRVLIEKPFGQDLQSARKLNQTLKEYFAEEQMYRIDHYLGKETVQKILVRSFDPQDIDHIQISALEKNGIENRGKFYEQTGALRDFVQNHLIQLVATIAMNISLSDTSAESLRSERAKIISSIRLPKPEELKDLMVLGQYQSYRQEKNVSPNSQVETYVALKLYLNEPSWQKIPFYLRTGKKLKLKSSQVSVHLKSGKDLVFKFKSQEDSYERLLLDFIQGDQKLFARTDEIEYSWRYTDALEQNKSKLDQIIYPDGSMGPNEAEILIQKDGKKWKNL